MGIPSTREMGFLFTATMGKLFTMTLGIQLTISNLTSRSIAFYDFLRREEPKLVVERSFGKRSRKRNAYKYFQG